MFIIQTGNLCMINIVIVGLTQTKLANLANTKVKREVLVAFINFSPLPVIGHIQFIPQPAKRLTFFYLPGTLTTVFQSSVLQFLTFMRLTFQQIWSLSLGLFRMIFDEPYL